MEILTYTEAQKVLKANKRKNIGTTVRWDAGDGWIGEGYYCTWKKRIVTSIVNAAGFRII